MVICLERDADLHMAQLMPLPLTVTCFSIIQIRFAVLVPAFPGSARRRAVKWVCVCVCMQNVILTELEATHWCEATKFGVDRTGASWCTTVASVSLRTMRSLTMRWLESGSRRRATRSFGTTRSTMAGTAASVSSTAAEVTTQCFCLILC